MNDRPVRQRVLPFAQPVIDEDAIAEVVETLRSRWLVTGPKVARFTHLLREYLGARHAVALSSASAGLHLALLVGGVRPGDEVITSPLTFAATANAIVHVGARPVFVDVDRSTQNIDPDRIAAVITARTRAIVPVHMAGRPCALDAISELAAQHELLVVEDAAHALGSRYHGAAIGTLSDFTVFSFHAAKNLTTGEGGLVTTGRADWADMLATYSSHGLSADAWSRTADVLPTHPLALVPGFKYGMTDVQAAIGIHQMARFEEWQTRREEIWDRYDEALAHLPLRTPSAPEPGTVHARHLYTVLLDIEALQEDRDAIRQRLREEGIATGVHFVALHRHPYYCELLGHDRGDFPAAEWLSERTLSLPLGPHVSDEDVADVVTAIEKVLATRAGAQGPP